MKVVRVFSFWLKATHVAERIPLYRWCWFHRDVVDAAMHSHWTFVSDPTATGLRYHALSACLLVYAKANREVSNLCANTIVNVNVCSKVAVKLCRKSAVAAYKCMTHLDTGTRYTSFNIFLDPLETESRSHLYRN